MEVLRFYNIGFSEFVRIVSMWGPPTEKIFRKNLVAHFTGNTDPDSLKITYERISQYYALRLMMSFQREDDVEGFVKVMNGHERRLGRKMNVIDYGCGVSDLGLIVASLGHHVTICDLDDSKLDFTFCRYKRNDFTVNVIAILDTEKLPDLREGEFDIIIASEIMKQVRHPLALLRLFYRILKPSGLFYCTQGTPESGWFGSKAEGDRLEEAIQIGNSGAYKQFFQTHFVKYTESEDRKYWWVPVRDPEN
ncbi:MAG: class I SAM-dependent methyltransferase [Candidatus Hodarchaeota archaeon]